MKNLKKIDMIMGILLVLVFVLHGVMGAAQMLGFGYDAGKMLARIGTLLVAAHALFGVFLTVSTIIVQKKSGGRWYFAANRTFWIRRISGIVLLVSALLHFGIFTHIEDGMVEILPFTIAKFGIMFLLVFSMFVHIFTSIHSSFVTEGHLIDRKSRARNYAMLGTFMVLMLIAIVAYFISWSI